MRKLLVTACLSLAAAGLFTQLSSAAFTGSLAAPSNGITADALRNYFSVSPGTDVQPGTSTAVASGNVDGLSIDLGTVPSARTFSNVFRITNVSSATQTATLNLSSVPQVSSAVFASNQSASVTLAAGASTTLSVTTSTTVAGRGTGTLRLGLSGSSWLYRDYSFHVDEAPEAPGAPTGTQKPAGRIDLSWAASTTTMNLAGYDVYRSSGAAGTYTKLTATPQTALTYSDTATVDGTAYTYKINAVSSGTPVLNSLDSTTVGVTADATAPGQATSITLTNGGGNGGAYVNSSNSSGISVAVALPAGSLTTDVVQLTATVGGSVTATHAGYAGAGTVNFTGINVSGLGDGTLTLSVISTDLAGNVSSVRTVTVTKDTVAPGAPTAAYTDNNNSVADAVSGTAEANASVSVTKTAPAPTAGYATSANGAGSYTATVAAVSGKPNAPIGVTYAVTATDAAGNTSSVTTLSLNDTH
jgi:large repetitive protein